jgi:hypothetical protein
MPAGSPAQSEPDWRKMAVLRGFREFRREEPEERAGSAATIDFQEGHAGL